MANEDMVMAKGITVDLLIYTFSQQSQVIMLLIFTA